MKIIFRILVLTFLISYSIGAQRETRAVWLTTNFNLDWPLKNSTEKEQKTELRNIFKNLKDKNFNTIYFQVRSNGTVLYNSAIEPFSPYLTGEVDVKPNYDPLQYAIELGREFNIEVHAWVNMIRCFSGSDDGVLKHPKHIINTHRNWTVRIMDSKGGISFWLNPSYYQVQDYLVDLLDELATNYDIDGLQLDFLRYPGKTFEDEKYFDSYGFKMSLADWRRNNITNILRKFKARVKPKNPYLKVGVTPIGIRKNLDGATGWEGYHSVFQDTETWLDEGLVDYLAPQIYWDMHSNPKFEILAKDWINKSHGKNIILGLAAYKNDVKPELNDMIELSRKLGAAGIAFFRYRNIENKNNNYFSQFSLPRNMPWKEKKQSEILGINTSISQLNKKEILISWKDSSNNSDFYRAYAIKNDNRLIKIIGLEKNKVKLNFGKPSKLMYNYKISKLDRLWNDAVVSENLRIFVPFLKDLKLSSFQSPKTFLQKISDEKAVLIITAENNHYVSIDIFNKENLRIQTITKLKTGINIISLAERTKLIKSIIVTNLTNGAVEKLNLI